ncbi:MAG: NAD(P)/FAD-dependent oxidoreductase [Gemmatimonadota bacterium]|nr:NAD(P)/FAD-dependent oxidoreductase [Gemmatimonadota bacterium]MDE3172389.1 NAD(P)/FAD-dependent oxidoreductase [Gemmatimonadota bacterium]
MTLDRPRVLVVGGGFGGLYAARALRASAARVTVVDRTNHHLFQPLLYQAATATLAPSDITAPIRWLLRKQPNVEVLMASVDRIDVERREAVADGGALAIPYDYLILAAGARHSYFGHPEWETAAPGLKSIDDAIRIRQRVLLAFERAEKTGDEDRRRRELTFVIVGGGPTGVELAGMLPTIARDALAGDFRRVDTRRARVILLEGGPRLLPAYPAPLSEAARRSLEALGVEVRTGARVTHVARGVVEAGAERIHAATIVWAAGNEASPLGTSLGAPLDGMGRVVVEPDLSIPGHPEVFVVGDQAAMTSGGRPVPGVAPAAMQSGRWAAANVKRRIAGESTRAFRYLDKGDLATIGRYRAVARFGRVRVSGPLAWWLWLFVHILYLAGFRNRASVLVEWGYAFFTYQRGSRLITGLGRSPAA